MPGFHSVPPAGGNAVQRGAPIRVRVFATISLAGLPPHHKIRASKKIGVSKSGNRLALLGFVYAAQEAGILLGAEIELEACAKVRDACFEMTNDECLTTTE